ncbi:MAG: LytTR family DNA-binding domain-containing protein [Bacteroidota bacterium]
MLTALLIDDEEDAREVLRGLINLFCPEIEKVIEADGGKEALSVLRNQEVDITFLDIELRRESGLDLAEQLISYCPHIIFVTAHDQYAVEAFQTPATSYLLKPVVPDYLKDTIQRILLDRKSNTHQKRLLLPTRTGMIVLNQQEIIRIEGDGNYCHFICTDGQRYYLSRNLSYYEKLVDVKIFFRVHQSHLVNLYCVRSVGSGNENKISLIDGETIPFSKSKKQAILDALTNL